MGNSQVEIVCLAVKVFPTVTGRFSGRSRHVLTAFHGITGYKLLSGNSQMNHLDTILVMTGHHKILAHSFYNMQVVIVWKSIRESLYCHSIIPPTSLYKLQALISNFLQLQLLSGPQVTTPNLSSNHWTWPGNRNTIFAYYKSDLQVFGYDHEFISNISHVRFTVQLKIFNEYPKIQDG